MNQEEIERNIAFIVDQQAKFFADIEAMKEHGKKTDALLDTIGKRLSRAIRLGIAEARQEREKRREAEERLSSKMDILLDAQIRADEQMAELREAQLAATAETAMLKQALAEMAHAVKTTNQRVSDLEQRTA